MHAFNAALMRTEHVLACTSTSMLLLFPELAWSSLCSCAANIHSGQQACVILCRSISQSQHNRAHILQDLQGWHCCHAVLHKGPHRPCCSQPHDTNLPQKQIAFLKNTFNVLSFLWYAKALHEELRYASSQAQASPKCSPACLSRTLPRKLLLTIN